MVSSNYFLLSVPALSLLSPVFMPPAALLNFCLRKPKTKQPVQPKKQWQVTCCLFYLRKKSKYTAPSLYWCTGTLPAKEENCSPESKFIAQVQTLRRASCRRFAGEENVTATNSVYQNFSLIIPAH